MYLAVESLFFVHVALISLRHQSQTNQPSKQTAVIVVVTTFVVIFFRVHVVTCYTNVLHPSILLNLAQKTSTSTLQLIGCL